MRIDYSDRHYYAKQDVAQGLVFLEKAKRIQELIAERGLDVNGFRAKELNQVGNEQNTMEFMGGRLLGLRDRKYLKIVAQKTEKIEIVWNCDFEITNKETGEKVVTGWYSEWRYPRNKFDVKEINVELRTVNSRYNVYSLDPTLYEEVKAFVIASIEAL